MDAEFVRRRKTVSLTANKTFTRVDLGTSFNNRGAAGEVDVTLPSDAVAGDFFHAGVIAAQVLKIKAGAAAVFILAGTALTAGHGISSNTAGASTLLECVASGVWLVHLSTNWADAA